MMTGRAKLDEYHQGLDGRLFFSYREKQIAELRASKKGSKVWKVLGQDDTFSPAFKKAIRDDHEDILGRQYLVGELKGAKRVLKGLQKRSGDPQVDWLLRRLRADPVGRRRDEILCPMWRHIHSLNMTTACIPRYFFPEKASEISLVTIVFDFAENLEVLEDKIVEARAEMMDVIASFTKRGRGIVAVGSFEPDLRSYSELTRMDGDPRKLLLELGKQPPASGGWILSGHFLVRITVNDELRDELKQRFPSMNWNRVQFDPVHRNKSLAESVMRVLGYVAKYPDPLFKYPTRGKKLAMANKLMQRVNTAFVGPSWGGLDDQSEFDVEAAIRQWALFIDRMGASRMYFAYESCHAQKWYSRSEWQCIREFDLDVFRVGGNDLQITEPRRDFGLKFEQEVPKRLKGKLQRFRTRRLKYDPDWIRKTDIGGPPFYSRPISFDIWLK